MWIVLGLLSLSLMVGAVVIWLHFQYEKRQLDKTRGI